MAELNDVKTASVSVGITPTLLTAALASRVDGRIIQNVSSVDVFVGGSAVATTTGLKLAAGESLSVDGPAPLYGIVATGTADVRVLEGS